VDHSYSIPAHVVTTEQVIKRSRFICTLGHAETTIQASSHIAEIRQQNPQANHVCWAYIAGPPDSADRGMSDDGEPRGTAGKPMLSILEYSGLGEIYTTVTRYFGGIKLGTGGLVRAYSSSVQQALALVKHQPKVDLESFRIVSDYPFVRAIELILSEEQSEILNKNFHEKVEFVVQIPAERITQITKKLAGISSGALVLEPYIP
jgi:uncharacterized YigZ family protein